MRMCWWQALFCFPLFVSQCSPVCLLAVCAGTVGFPQGSPLLCESLKCNLCRPYFDPVCGRLEVGCGPLIKQLLCVCVCQCVLIIRLDSSCLCWLWLIGQRFSLGSWPPFSGDCRKWHITRAHTHAHTHTHMLSHCGVKRALTVC